jgi:hypothetical protein
LKRASVSIAKRVRPAKSRSALSPRDEDFSLADGGQHEEHLICLIRATGKARRAGLPGRDELAIREISAQQGFHLRARQAEFRIREEAQQLADGFAAAQGQEPALPPELPEPRQTPAREQGRRQNDVRVENNPQCFGLLAQAIASRMSDFLIPSRGSFSRTSSMPPGRTGLNTMESFSTRTSKYSVVGNFSTIFLEG